MYPFPTAAMTKQTFKAEDGSIIHYDTDTKEVRREETKVVSPLLRKPENSDSYFFIIDKTICTAFWFGATIDEHRWEFGNVYFTYEEAEQARAKKLAQVRVLRRIAELNEGWVPDWEYDKAKHCVGFDHMCHAFYASFEYGQEKANEWYLKSREVAESLIASHYDDLKLIFGISKS
ncbi:hypothetical protein [Caudoviricetes sp.]|nr:hypothetical protein [Caudoviricetes sp.]